MGNSPDKFTGFDIRQYRDVSKIEAARGVRRSGLIVPLAAVPHEFDTQGTLLGSGTTDMLRFMHHSRFTIWQDLPMVPPDENRSPYSSVSSFAIDPMRIELSRVVDIEPSLLEAYQAAVESDRDGAEDEKLKDSILDSAYETFGNSASAERKQAFRDWCETESEWLYQFAEFEISKNLEGNRGKQWFEWEHNRFFKQETIDRLIHTHEFQAICYKQWIAEQQTLEYVELCRKFGVEPWNDIPFYTGPCDVRANYDKFMFHLFKDGSPMSQSGALPSQTSETGQLWGHPTYRDEDATIDWWVKRLVRAIKLCGGKVRLDHFIGFAQPRLNAANAKDGTNSWQGPAIGEKLFPRLDAELRKIGLTLRDIFHPEDLGQYTHLTTDMRDRWGLQHSAIASRGLRDYLAKDEVKDSIHNPANWTRDTLGSSENHDIPTIVALIERIRNERPDRFVMYVDKLRGIFPEEGISTEMDSTSLAFFELHRILSSGADEVLLLYADVALYSPEEFTQYNKPGSVGHENWSHRITAAKMKQIGRTATLWHDLNVSSGR